MLPSTRAVKALTKSVAAVSSERARAGFSSSAASFILSSNGVGVSRRSSASTGPLHRGNGAPASCYSTSSATNASDGKGPLGTSLASLPLTIEPPGIPVLTPARNLPTPQVRISTLSNGLRVATQETYGQVASMALFLDAGSMYEEGDSVGACHFLETTAYKSTANRTADEISSFCTRTGIATSAVFNKEVLMYRVDCLRADIDDALSILSETILCPRLTDEELDTARRVIAFQRDEASSQPQVTVSDHLYMAAYGHATPLGRPEKCPDTQIPLITAETLRRYTKRHFTAPRMVLSAVGIDHDTAVAAAEKFFSSVPASNGEPGVIKRPKVPYVGGDVRSCPDWSALPPTIAAATAKTEFTHMMLAFPTVGWSDDDVVPVCVVDTLLGGGSSFSAGGPGKGMYSRLYREVLNSFAWVDAANAFSTQLYDCGVVGIYAACPPDKAGALATIAANQLARLTEQPVRQGDLARARNQLASSVMMNLETRALLCEDIGRQILSHGKRMDPAELVRRIQAVTAEDIIRVTRNAMSKPPSFAVVGEGATAPAGRGGLNQHALPSYEALQTFFDAQSNKFR